MLHGYMQKKANPNLVSTTVRAAKNAIRKGTKTVKDSLKRSWRAEMLDMLSSGDGWKGYFTLGGAGIVGLGLTGTALYELMKKDPTAFDKVIELAKEHPVAASAILSVPTVAGGVAGALRGNTMKGLATGAGATLGGLAGASIADALGAKEWSGTALGGGVGALLGGGIGYKLVKSKDKDEETA